MTGAAAGAVGYEVDDGTPPTIRIIPSDPILETSGDGVPTAMLYVSGATGLLNLGVRWWPSEMELNEIRKRVGAALGRAPAEFMVTPDAVDVTGFSLLLAAAPGGELELARSRGSGAPPYSALFSVDVSEHLDPVRRACAGEPRLLYVQVEAELSRGRSATTILTAQLGPWVRELLAAAEEDLPARVDALVGNGAIARTRGAAPEAGAAPADLAAEADRLAAARLVAALRTMPPPDGAVATVAVAATARRPERTPLLRRADVGRRLRASPSRHLLVAADPPDGGGRTTPGGGADLDRRVRLDLPADGAPVASVELSGGGEQVTVVPPFPTEVTVAGAENLTVTTRYPDGDDPYRVTLAADSGGWTLAPVDLGLVQVSVDASRVHEAGATAVAADVFYQPEDRGSPDRRTVRFEGDSWRADWFVVSRAPELAGQLVLELTVTPPGAAGVPARIQSDAATVRL